MATGGGEISGRKAGRHDQDSVDELDYLCCVCSKKHIRRQATKYCVNCQDYYCGECVQVHDVVPSLSEHVVVGESDFSRRASAGFKLPSVPTERCNEHTTKLIDMYCKNHDEVGCATCMTLKHDGPCEKLYIPNNIKQLFRPGETRAGEEHLKHAIGRMKAALNQRHQRKDELKKAISDASQSLNDYVEEIQAILNELKEATTTSLGKLREEIESPIENQKLELIKTIAAAEDILEKTKHANSCDSNESQRYVCSKLAAAASRDCGKLCSDMDSRHVQKITFSPHVPSKKMFNTFSDTSKPAPSLGMFTVVDKVSEPIYKIRNKTKIGVRLPEDTLKTFISGSCILHNGTCVLADNQNMSLKCLLPPYSYVYECLELRSQPWAVCAVSQTEVAVTLPHVKEIVFSSAERTVKKTRTVKVDFMCYSICCRDDELFVCDNSTVYVFPATGTWSLLRQISVDSFGKALFSNIKDIAIGVSNHLLYVGDFINGLMTVDCRTGNVVWMYKKDLRGVCGLCLCDKGRVLVCGWRSHNVIQVSGSGEREAQIVGSDEGIRNPTSLCYDQTRNVLIVTQGKDEHVIVLELTKSLD